MASAASCSSSSSSSSSSSDDDDDEEEVAAAKALERPACADWAARGLAATWWPQFLLLLERDVSFSSTSTKKKKKTPPCREAGNALSRARFVEKYEMASVMCVVEDSNVVDASTRRETWTLRALRTKYGSINMRVSDTHGAMIGLDTYIKYGRETRDDAPFGIYDSQILDDFDALGSAYRRPLFVSQCAFRRAFGKDGDNGDSECPPSRWLLIGAPRSGTGLHVDPLGTHAWVYLIEGFKLWLARPPDSSNHDDVTDTPQTPTAEWLASEAGDAFRRADDCLEFVQRPGELVYVPARWRHAVLNLDWTVALTENYCTDLADVQHLVRRDEPALYARMRRFGRLARAALALCRANLVRGDSSFADAADAAAFEAFANAARLPLRPVSSGVSPGTRSPLLNLNPGVGDDVVPPDSSRGGSSDTVTLASSEM